MLAKQTDAVEGGRQADRAGGSGIRAIPWALALGSAAAFLPVLTAGFVRWDDDINFLNNPAFGSLSPQGLRWAWATYWLGVYQPLGWMLFEGEHTLWGLDPRGYHATSLVLHGINAVMLYHLMVAILLRVGLDDDRTLRTGSAVAAALFAVHPLRVEVVAWASCQPYLPAVLCAMLAVLAYLRAHPEGTRGVRPGWLGVALLLSVAAMLWKPIAVSVPVLLLILDVYPLRRLKPGSRADARVWLEKLAFAVPAAVLMLIAVRARSDVGGDERVADFGLAARLALACYGAIFYLIKSAWPIGLSAYYPVPAHIDLLAGPFLGSAIAVAGISACALAVRRRFPGLLAAWVAYLVILAPNLGLIRTGGFLAADRYAYMASIPVTILVASIGARFLRWARNRLAVLTLAGTAMGGLLIVLGALSWSQCRTWQTSTALWTNALAQSQGNNLAIERSLAASLIDEGEAERGIALLRRVLAKDPEAPMVHYNLGIYDSLDDRLADAEGHFLAAVRGFDPGSPYLADAHFNLGAVFERQGRLDEALAQYEIAARLNPHDPETWNNWGSVLLQLGRYTEAEVRFSEALRLRPGYALARRALAHARRMKALEMPGDPTLPLPLRH